MRRTFVLSTVLSLAVTAAAAAQPREPRVFIGVNAGIHTATSDLSSRLEFEENVETATADIDYPSKAGVAFDGGAGVRLWKRFGAGIAVSRFTRDGSADVVAQIPHPFFFGRPREISGTAAVSRSETGVHLQLMYIVPTSSRFRILLSAGPSRLEAEQDLVTAVRYDDEFPFDAATYRPAEQRGFKESAIGFNAGADVAFMLTRAIGLGAAIRFSRASVDLGPDGGRVSTDLGGLQAGGGLRIAF